MWLTKALKALLLTLVTAGSLGQAYPPNSVWRPRSRTPLPHNASFPAEPQYWELVLAPPARASKRPA